jgi:hypothetical protein
LSKKLSTITLPIAATVVLLGVLMLGAAPAAAQSEGQIGGIVYIDENGNGIRETGEEGLGDVEVTFDSADWNTTINTGDNGAFSIALNPATWTVTVAPPTGYKAPKSSVEVVIRNAGEAVTNVEFGLVPLEDGEVLPAGGAPISSSVMIGGLVGVLVVGLALVVVGQYRSKSAL